MKVLLVSAQAQLLAANSGHSASVTAAQDCHLDVDLDCVIPGFAECSGVW